MTRLVDHLLIGAAIAAISYTQLTLKWQANLQARRGGGDGLLDYLVGMLVNPWTLSALLATCVALPLWLIVLGRMPLSYVYPFVSLSFVVVGLGGAVLLGEPLTALRVGGLALIVAGVALVGLSQA